MDFDNSCQLYIAFWACFGPFLGAFWAPTVPMRAQTFGHASKRAHSTPMFFKANNIILDTNLT